jgi:hypothetical protein
MVSLATGCTPSREPEVKVIPRTKQALVVRTDFSDDTAWHALCTAIQEPVGEYQFRAYVDFLSDPAYDGLTPDQLRSLMPNPVRSFFFVIDRMALSHPEHPILVVDLYREPGRSFRVIPSEMWGVENNLSLSNMDFDEFARSVDQDGVFRGFPEP